MSNLFITLIAAISLAINTQSWKTSLPVVLFGMVGIFIVIGVIVLLTYLLNKLTSSKAHKKNKNNNDK